MNVMKKIIKKLFIEILFHGCPKIVIASTGRSGSTMLFEAIGDSLVAHRFHVKPDGFFAKEIKSLSMGYVDRISTLPGEPYVICKTHDTYDHPPKTDDKYVFVYGDPLDSAMSVEQVVEKEGLDWFAQHQYHLKASGGYSDLYDKDVLNYQGQIESWLTKGDRNKFCVDYEDLWGASERLSDFLGFSVKLPARRARLNKPEKKIDVELFEKLRNFKEEMKRKYESSIEHENRV